MKVNRIIQGDCLEVLKTLPPESVNMCITSPPYYGLRDYCTGTWEGGDPKCDHKKNPEPLSEKALCKSTIGAASSTGHALENYKKVCAKCGAVRVDLQLGLELTISEYLDKLCNIFDGVKRVLRDDGTLWVNLGTSYLNKDTFVVGQEYFDYLIEKDGQNILMKKCNHKWKWVIKNKHRKCVFCGLDQKGYLLLAKNDCNIPARFSIEMQTRGWILRNILIWDKPSVMPSSVKDRFSVSHEYIFFFSKKKKYYFKQQKEPATSTDNSVRDRDHTKLNNTPGRTRMGGLVTNHYTERNKRSVWRINAKPFKGLHFATYSPELIEVPIKAGCPKGGIVLDPFMGAGTTGVVARQQEKNYIGIELNPEYIEIAEKRIAKVRYIQTGLFDK